jgi:hypothetical protein
MIRYTFHCRNPHLREWYDSPAKAPAGGGDWLRQGKAAKLRRQSLNVASVWRFRTQDLRRASRSAYRPSFAGSYLPSRGCRSRVAWE